MSTEYFKGVPPIKKLFAQTGNLGLTENAMDECFSAVWNGYSPTQSEIFHKAADALLHSKPLEFTYRSPGADRQTRRIVEPHHLQHYMASWVLIAWCRKRSNWRKFYLARISDLSVLNESFEKKPASIWNHLLEGAFGIFQGDALVDVVLRFSPFRSRWVREQSWHPDQKIQDLADGGLELTLPVADFREIKMRILQFGADVEVISPADLRQEVATEVRRLQDLYEKTAG
ncbi:MAG: WYL domain-containing protein [Desulfobacterales bacterium]|nr:WYL domain-containing protein [Desulfobacterales bacterium]MDD4072741.1 WYL domain-containing protein [Desulfobacterales bacterium]MDD4392378.1 WYL domain-containing protein [Desulfobacterales bacterium]